MSVYLNKIIYLLDYGWAMWCGLLKHQTTWWDPYGATVGALLVMLFLGLAVKVARE